MECHGEVESRMAAPWAAQRPLSLARIASGFHLNGASSGLGSRVGNDRGRVLLSVTTSGFG